MEADEIQKRIQNQTMMQPYQTNQTDDIDTDTWARMEAFFEGEIWARIISEGEKENPTTALETLVPETDTLQLIFPFIE